MSCHICYVEVVVRCLTVVIQCFPGECVGACAVVRMSSSSPGPSDDAGLQERMHALFQQLQSPEDDWLAIIDEAAAKFYTLGFHDIEFLSNGSHGCAVVVRKDYTSWVLKIMKRDGRELGRELWRREVKALVTCNHPNLVRMYNAFVLPFMRVVEMEFCNRGTLETPYEVYNGTPMPPPIVKAAFGQICAGVRYMHNRAKLVHCDLKPANVFISDGSSWMVKVGDFGLSVAVGQEVRGGTKYYMPPENKTTSPSVAH